MLNISLFTLNPLELRNSLKSAFGLEKGQLGSRIVVVHAGGQFSTPMAIAKLELYSKQKPSEISYITPPSIDSDSLRHEVENELAVIEKSGELSGYMSRADALLERVISEKIEAPQIKAVIEKTKKALKNADAIFLPGGPDVPRAFYGDTPVLEDNYFLALREFVAIREARNKGIPLMGVCRGLQVANVYFGSSLVRDLEGHCGVQDIDLVQEDLKGIVTPILKEGLKGRVWHLNGVPEGDVNNKELDVLAVKNGIVKAMEIKHGTAAPFILTQFHPEMYHSESPKVYDPLSSSFYTSLSPENEKFYQIFGQCAKVYSVKKAITEKELKKARLALKPTGKDLTT